MSAILNTTLKNLKGDFNMKKIISIVALLLALTFVLTACGKFTCDFCDEEKSGKKHEIEILGEKGVACDECYEEMDDFLDLFD